MDKLKGYRTFIAAAIYVLYGVAAGLGWVPDPAEAAQLDGTVAAIVAFLTNPLVVGLVFAALRWVTTTPPLSGEAPS